MSVYVFCIKSIIKKLRDMVQTKLCLEEAIHQNSMKQVREFREATKRPRLTLDQAGEIYSSDGRSCSQYSQVYGRVVNCMNSHLEFAQRDVGYSKKLNGSLVCLDQNVTSPQ